VKKPLVITVAHQKGGVGKSTLAVNLAISLQKLVGQDLKLVDLDMQQSLTTFNKRRTRSGAEALPVETVGSIEALKKVLKDNAVTIIDVGGFDADINRVAIAAADVIITPVSDSAIELDGLQSFRSKIIAKIREIKPELKATILLNRIHPFAGKSLEELYDYARSRDEFNIFETIVRDRSEFKKSFEVGQGVEEFAPDSKATEEINQLIQELINE
jgi:chromosome partitioning protein